MTRDNAVTRQTLRVRRVVKFSVRLGVLAVLALVLMKLLDDETVEPAPKLTVDEPPWVEPDGTACPASHPIKAKLSSKVFRGPQSPGYANSKPDRCYASEDAARADGLREAKR